MATSPRQPIKTSVLIALLPALTVVIAIAYAVAAYFLLIMPKLGELVAGGELDLAALEKRIADDEAYAKRLDAAVTEFAAMNPERKQKATAIVTPGPDVPGILVQLDELTRRHGMVLVSVDAVPDEKSLTPAGRKTVRISANVAGGTYRQFKLFLADVERSLRLFDPYGVIFTPNTGNFGLVLRAYYLDAQPAPVPPAP